jgi:cell division protein FtsB
MRWQKRYWSRLLLCVEIALFFGIYWWGTDGLIKLHQSQKENSQLATDVVLLNAEIDKLEKEIVAYQQDPFFREKQAREQLQMARKNEEIFLIANKGDTRGEHS